MNFYNAINNIFGSLLNMKISNKILNQSKEFTNEVDREKFISVGKVFEITEDYRDSEQPFKATFISDGQRSLILDDLTPKDWENIRSLDFDRLNSNLASKLADAVWERYHDNKYGEIAVHRYLELGKQIELINSKDIFEVDIIQRAYIIAAKLNKKGELLSKVVSYIHSTLHKTIFKNNGPMMWLLKFMLEQEIKIDNEDFLFLQNIIDDSKDKNDIQHAFELQIRIYRKSDLEKAKEIENKLAFWLEQQADEQEGFQRKIYLEEAHKHFIKAGNTQAKDQVELDLMEINGEIANNLQRIEIDIPDELKKEFFRFKDEVDNWDLSQSIKGLIKLVDFYDAKQLLEELNDNEQGSLVSLFTSVFIDGEGNTINTLPTAGEEDKGNVRLQYALTKRMNFVGDFYLRSVFDHIESLEKEENSFFDRLINLSVFISENRKKIINKGFMFAFNGDYYVALHILAPQWEFLLNRLVKESGKVPIDYKIDGTSRYDTVKPLIEKLKDTLEENVIVTLENIFQPSGINIRNRIAHGLMAEDDAKSGSSLFYLAIFLRFIAYGVPQKEVMEELYAWNTKNKV